MGENYMQSQLATKIIGTALRVQADAPTLPARATVPKPLYLADSHLGPFTDTSAELPDRTRPSTLQAVEA